MNINLDKSKFFPWSLAMAAVGVLAMPLMSGEWVSNTSTFSDSSLSETPWTITHATESNEEEVDWTLAKNEAGEDETDWTLAKNEAEEDETDWTLAKNEAEEDETDWTLAKNEAEEDETDWTLA